MNLTLFSIDKALCKAWEAAFADCEDVAVLHGSLGDLSPQDALITAGNAYGIMNGGIDLAVRNYYGVEIQDAVQWAIVQHYGGFLPVGNSICITTEDKKFPHLIYAPTMVTPRPIASGDIYAIFYSVLHTAGEYDSVACCGLGAGVGAVKPQVVADMMLAAYDVWRR